jgi:hypothetical protein
MRLNRLLNKFQKKNTVFFLYARNATAMLLERSLRRVIRFLIVMA